MKNVVLCCIALVLLPTAVFAVQVTNLYTAEIPVSNQTEVMRQQAEKQGLVQVLVKLTGDTKIDGRADIKHAIKEASHFVQEFSYQPGHHVNYPFSLSLRYDPNMIQTLLQRAHMTPWGEDRPLILVWLANSTSEQGTELVGAHQSDKMAQALLWQSQLFGLPLLFPELDLADTSQITVEDITRAAIPVVKEASKRYSAAKVLLIGKVHPTDSGYFSDWHLVVDDQDWHWTATDKTEGDIATGILRQTMETLSRYYGITDNPGTGSPQWIKVQVDNITARAQLKQLTDAIKQLHAVQQIHLAQVSGDRVELAVQVRASMETFQQNAAVADKLQFKSRDSDNNLLVYEWVN
jgi:hypothetical protein